MNYSIKATLIVLCCTALSLLNVANAQSGHASVRIDTTGLPCNCTKLTAVPFGGMTTGIYNVQEISFTPPDSFNTGQQLGLYVDNMWSHAIPLPFNFCFFDSFYRSIIIGTNGVISFDTVKASTTNANLITQPIPSTLLPDMRNCIMAPWQDLDNTNTGEIYFNVTGTAPHRIFKVSWYDVPLFGDANSVNANICPVQHHQKQMVLLYETSNVIEIYIRNKEVCNGWNGGLATEGIQNAVGNGGYFVPGRNDTIWTAQNDAWRFAPHASENYVVGWYNGNTGMGMGAHVDTLIVCPSSPTNYRAEVTFKNCDGTHVIIADSVNVDAANPVVINNVNVTNATCSEGGTIKADASGGTGTLTYLWCTGHEGDTLSHLNAQTYVLTVTDDEGCADTLGNNNVLNNCAIPDTGVVLWGIAYAPELPDITNGGMVAARSGGNSSPGAIFSFGTDSFLYTEPHFFNADLNDGINPVKLLLANNGNLYGANSFGNDVLFGFNPTANTYEHALPFSSVNALNIQCNLTQASNGKIYGVTDNGGLNGEGFVFSLDPSNSSWNVIADLADSAGRVPASDLIPTSGGKLFGTMNYGGKHGYGVAYSFDPSTNSYADVHDFDSTSGKPSASFLLGTDGKLYGITHAGGSVTFGIIYSIDPSTGTYSPLKTLNTTTGYEPDALIQGRDGKLYGITHAGGSITFAFGTLFSFNPVGNIFTKITDLNDTTGNGLSSNLLQATDGKLYGITHAGGSVTFGVVVSYNPNTNILSRLKVLQDTSGYGGNYSISSYLMQASNGKIFGVNYDGGNGGSGVLFGIDTSTHAYSKLFDFANTTAGNPIHILEIPKQQQTGIAHLNKQQSLYLYPNPAGNRLIIEADKLKDESPDFSVVDITGKKIALSYEYKVGRIYVNTTSLTSGIYFTVMKFENSLLTGKFVKE